MPGEGGVVVVSRGGIGVYWWICSCFEADRKGVCFLMGVYRRRAQYHETDQMGIIHHSNYVKWMEEARIAFMGELGFGYNEVEKRGIVSPVAGISVSYKRPVLFDDVVEIEVSVKRYSGVVLELEYRFFNVTRNEVCTLASSKHCFTRDGKVVSLKKEIPELDGLFSRECG